MNIAELIASLMQGQNPNAAVVNSANAAVPAASAAPPSAPPSPPANAPQGVQTPVTNPQPAASAPTVTQSPPDLANMYLELMKKNQNAQQLDSGMSMIAAGLSKYPENRAALLQAAGSHGAGTTMTANDLIALQNQQVKMQDLLTQKAMLGGLMKRYNMSPEQAQYLQASGKMPEVLQHYSTENLTQVESPDGHKAFYNPRSGQQVATVPGEPPRKTQVYTDTNTGQSWLIDTQSGEKIKEITGETKPTATDIVKDDKTGEQNLIEKETGKTIKQLVPPRQPGQVVSEDEDKLFAINKDRLAAGKPPATMEEYLTRIKGKGQTINIGPQGQQFREPEPGFDYERNPDGTVKIDPNTNQPRVYAIQGGMAQIKQQEEQVKAKAASEKEGGQKVQQIFASSNTGSAVDTALKLADKMGVTGIGSRPARYLGGPGGMPWDDFDSAVNTIKSNVTQQTLSAMRANSPTGAGLGNVSDFEDKMLSNTIAPLSYYQSTSEVKKNLVKVKAAMELLADSNFNHDESKFKAALDARTNELLTEIEKPRSKSGGTIKQIRPPQ